MALNLVRRRPAEDFERQALEERHEAMRLGLQAIERWARIGDVGRIMTMVEVLLMRDSDLRAEQNGRAL